ncbi:MAG: thioredoxin family protein [Clostridiales bacterium]|nr:thioredoxin family protein [Clostridiales bacterium]
MVKIDSVNFEAEVLRSEKPVVLEFYSEGCIPCKRIAPVLAELEEEKPELKLAKANIKFCGDIVKKYSVMASPTVIFFHGGREQNRIRGVFRKPEIENAIEEAFK